jgi:hypothetical protein
MDTRVSGGWGIDELVEGDPVGAGQRKQQLERRSARAGLQPGEGTHRDAGDRRYVNERQFTLAAQCPQPVSDRCERLIEICDHNR